MYLVLVTFHQAKIFWNATVDILYPKLPRLHPMTWLADVPEHAIVSKKDAHVSVFVMWAIWSSRNKYTYEKLSAQTAIHGALISWCALCNSLPRMLPVKSRANAKWSPPSENRMKINIDVAFDLSLGVAWCGLIVRDHDGKFQAAACRRYDNITGLFTICSSIFSSFCRLSRNSWFLCRHCRHLLGIWNKNMKFNLKQKFKP